MLKKIKKERERLQFICTKAPCSHKADFHVEKQHTQKKNFLSRDHNSFTHHVTVVLFIVQWRRPGETWEATLGTHWRLQTGSWVEPISGYARNTLLRSRESRACHTACTLSSSSPLLPSQRESAFDLLGIFASVNSQTPVWRWRVSLWTPVPAVGRCRCWRSTKPGSLWRGLCCASWAAICYWGSSPVDPGLAVRCGTVAGNQRSARPGLGWLTVDRAAGLRGVGGQGPCLASCWTFFPRELWQPWTAASAPAVKEVASSENSKGDSPFRSADWSVACLLGWLVGWLSEWVKKRVSEWVNEWVSEWASEWVSEWVN